MRCIVYSMLNKGVNCLEASVLGAVLCFPASLWASDCTNLDSNAEWTKEFNEFNKQFASEDYHGAISTTDKMLSICPESPILNYARALTFRQIQDYDKAGQAIDDVFAHLQEFYVPPKLVQSMREMRYTISEERRIYQVTERDVKIEMLQQEVADTQVSLDTANGLVKSNDRLLTSYAEDAKVRSDIVMWSGVGVAGAGLLALGVGLGLYFKNEMNNKNSNGLIANVNDEDNSNVHLVTLKKSGLAAYVLIGTGTAATVVGAVMTGIGAYYHTHPINNDTAFNWRISPTDVSVGLTF